MPRNKNDDVIIISRSILTRRDVWREVRRRSFSVDPMVAAACDADVRAAINRGSMTVAEALAERNHAKK